ncbi:MAG: hypothetical protein ABUK01_16395 [Leptospirales bacterium]
MERRNLLIGVIWVFIFLIMGFFMEMQMISGREVWKQNPHFGLLKAAHVYGTAFGILNIIYALIIRSYSLQSEKMVQVGSLLAFIAALIYPVLLFLGAFETSLMIGAPVGAVTMIISYGILAVSLVKNSSN